jgi:diguanylate cyclase (GGDEF)-like protein
VSIVLGVLIGGVALPVGLRGDSLKWKSLGALLLTLAICSHHFTAMGAAAVVPDPTVQLSETALPSGLLAVAVALASFMIVVLALGGVALEVRERRRQELEADRMRGLANAAVEGLLIYNGETISTVNDNFVALVGRASADSIVGTRLEQYLADPDARVRLLKRENELVETVLLDAGGSEIAVEAIQRLVDLGGKPHRAIAIRDLRARKEAERNILFLAHHDALTGLPNRSTFNKRLDQEVEAALQSGRRLAVLCLDLDRFKEVNDQYGHEAGNDILIAVADEIKNAVRASDVAARYGGDEFVVILTRTDLQGGVRVAEALRAGIEGVGRRLGYPPALVTVSIGLAEFDPAQPSEGDLLVAADRALYRAKAAGRNAVA